MAYMPGWKVHHSLPSQRGRAVSGVVESQPEGLSSGLMVRVYLSLKAQEPGVPMSKDRRRSLSQLKKTDYSSLPFVLFSPQQIGLSLLTLVRMQSLLQPILIQKLISLGNTAGIYPEKHFASYLGKSSQADMTNINHSTALP